MKSSSLKQNSRHNMLVRVTNQHDEDIKNLSYNMQAIMKGIDFMTVQSRLTRDANWRTTR
jgi:hypothetical protein